MNDFKLYLEENKISEQQLIDWMTYMDKYYYKEIPSNVYYIKNSNIHGKGLFALNNLKENYIIGIACEKENRTQLARYANHSDNPNIEFRKEKENIVGYSLKPIKKNKELLVNYRHIKLYGNY